MIQVLERNIFDVRRVKVKYRLITDIHKDLQVLQWWTQEFVKAITLSLSRMPYGMRFMARETLQSVRVSIPSFIIHALHLPLAVHRTRSPMPL